ncbi:MAG TPA: hypothetical protein VK745_14750 [Polyangiaceae bacterium]|jgi:hypothetical protein|nr:hypothetical protein [Polyangiaceae bacterium]
MHGSYHLRRVRNDIDRRDCATGGISGPIAVALMAKAGELLAEPPKIEQVSLLAPKFSK